MRIIRLAEWFAVKYADVSADQEKSVRKDIGKLWDMFHKQFPVLEMLVQSSPSKPKNPHEKKAVAGHKFLKELGVMIDHLNKNSNIELLRLKEALHLIVKLIEDNRKASFDSDGKLSETSAEQLVPVQFPHVAALLFEVFNIGSKNDRRARDAQQAKARTGLSRILSLSLSMIDALNDIEMLSPEKFETKDQYLPEEVNTDEAAEGNRFRPQRGALSTYDIIDFLRQHGDQYGVENRDDWTKLFFNDPVLKEEITTVINALNRGHNPIDSVSVKMQIDDILRRHKEREAASNAELFGEEK